MGSQFPDIFGQLNTAAEAQAAEKRKRSEQSQQELQGFIDQWIGEPLRRNIPELMTDRERALFEAEKYARDLGAERGGAAIELPQLMRAQLELGVAGERADNPLYRPGGARSAPASALSSPRAPGGAESTIHSSQLPQTSGLAHGQASYAKIPSAKPVSPIEDMTKLLENAKPAHPMPEPWAPYVAPTQAAPIQVLRDSSGKVVGASNTGQTPQLPEGTGPVQASMLEHQDPNDAVFRRQRDYLAAVDDALMGGEAGTAQQLYAQMSPAEQRLADQAFQHEMQRGTFQNRLAQKQAAENEMAQRAQGMYGLGLEYERGLMADEATRRRVLQGKTEEQWISEAADAEAVRMAQEGAGLTVGGKPAPGLSDPQGRVALGLPPTKLSKLEADAIKQRSLQAAQQQLRTLLFAGSFPGMYHNNRLPQEQ